MAGRGQSGLRMFKKMARTTVVDPRPDRNGIKQPPYLRSHSAMQTSKRLKKYQSWIRNNLQGKRFKNRGGRLGVRRALIAAALEWQKQHKRTSKVARLEKILREMDEAIARLASAPKKAAGEYEFEEEEIPEYGEYAEDFYWE